MNPLVRERYNLIKSLTKKNNIFRWQNLCKTLNSVHNAKEIKTFAKLFGVPPQFWNNPRMVCSLITPRVSDFLEKVHCDNADEPTMEGDPVGDLPEYLKYTYMSTNGKVYCSSIVDLYNAVQVNQTMDPYRRFELDVTDITERFNFLKKVIEPQGLGSSIMDNIKNIALQLTPQAVIRNKIMTIWGALRYPKYTVDELTNASEPILNGIWEALIVQDGLSSLVTRQEKVMFSNAENRNEKLRILTDTMFRLVSYDNADIVPVALELAINNSVERSNARRRSLENEDFRNVRSRVDELSSNSESDSETESDMDDVNIEPYHEIQNLRSWLSSGGDGAVALYDEITTRIENRTTSEINFYDFPERRRVRMVFRGERGQFDGWISNVSDQQSATGVPLLYGIAYLRPSDYNGRSDHSPPFVVTYDLFKRNASNASGVVGRCNVPVQDKRYAPPVIQSFARKDNGELYYF